MIEVMIKTSGGLEKYQPEKIHKALEKAKNNLNVDIVRVIKNA